MIVLIAQGPLLDPSVQSAQKQKAQGPLVDSAIRNGPLHKTLTT